MPGRPGHERAEALPRPRASVDTPAAGEWKDLVRRATDRMRAGDFEKVVLARRVDVTADREFDVPAAVRRMRETYAGTTVFALGHGDTTFLGATPEYLVRVEDREVHSWASPGRPRAGTPPTRTGRWRQSSPAARSSCTSTRSSCGC